MAGKVNQVPALTEAPYRIKTIVIDAGHGGKDPGCSGANSREKHIALAVCLKLAENIRAQFPNIRVILTRDRDVFIPLYERAAIANRANADLFISVHCNFLPGSSATRGTETYVMGLHTADHNLNVAKRENDAILLEEDYEKNYDYDPNSPEGHIMLSMFQNAYLEQSILLAEKFEAHVAQNAGRRSRGVKQAGFVVLKETTMPSILAEIGFLSNAKEEAFLLTDGGQDEIVNALSMAFAEYKQIMENGAFTVGNMDRTVASTPLDGKKVDTAPSQSNEPLIPMDRAPAEKTSTKTTASAYPAPTTGNTAASKPMNVSIQKSDRQVTVRSPYGNETEVTPNNVVRPVTSPPPAGTASEPQMGRRSVPNTTVKAAIEMDRRQLQYCVQLAASPKPLNTQHARWADITYRIEVIREDNYYKYQARSFPDLETANKARAHLQHQGFMDAFIVIYREGIRLSPAETKAILEGVN